MQSKLTRFQVWDRLEVGPPLLERRRLRMPYRIVAAGQEHTEELIYRYHEDVFDPDADLGLAGMIGAQLALNYGLFAGQIVLHGRYDNDDRRLLRGMAENTAREIAVNKLAKPNPFLRLDEPLVLERGDIFAPRLRFADPVATDPGPAWQLHAERALVLSSGGKDSLLSLGLLEELGVASHPVFVNESGRHWYTALNAWRHLEATRPTAARVWCNCDRVFNWALRHLPFVRPDFADVRADIYPIRLWTVAVFLFGTLPLVRKRGLGRLVVGDEFDTSERLNFQGIPHYGGLYDQSRWFDEALTRYFARKGWAVTQFSVLRSASELLIQRILLSRYPELQAHQTSCHATHVVGDRVQPCGRCEKCRRIVGMIVALGEDPGRCGYDPAMVTRALSDLAGSGVKQIADDAAHLAWLLVSVGAIPSESTFGQGARPHPETLAMRFDPVGSPPQSIPRDLRAGVHGLLAEHADGVVMRKGRSWLPVDPLAPELLSPSHASDEARQPAEQIEPERDPTLWAHLTWPQAAARLREVDTALLPVGAIEQHGPHLPLDVDFWDVEYLAHEVARRCSDPKPLVMPGLPYGVSYHHDDFAGTVSVGPDTLARMVHDIGMSAARQGIRKLLILNGHGGNLPALHFAAQLINRDARIFTAVDTGESSDAEVAALIETEADVHAGECETSTTLATRPHLVRLDHAARDVPRFDSRYLEFGSRVGLEWYVRTARISESGTMGDPTRASKEKGQRVWRIQIDNLVDLVEHLKSTPLERLHRPAGP